jgi:hypothetical protein
VCVLWSDTVLQQHSQWVKLPHKILLTLVAKLLSHLILNVRVDDLGDMNLGLEGLPDLPEALNSERFVGTLRGEMLHHQQLKV